MNVGFERLKAIEARIGDTFYLLSLDRVAENLAAFERAFSCRYPAHTTAYSFKTNYAPALCRFLKATGAQAEVVSEMEYEIALSLGYRAGEIIVNGPVHRPAFVERILSDGACFNVDGWPMLEIVGAYCQRHSTQPVAVGLRLNYAVAEAGTSRFGFDTSAPGIDKLVAWFAQHPNCRLAGLHSHFSNSSRSLESFASRIHGLLAAVPRLFPGDGPDYLDVGGGFFGNMPASLAHQVAGYIPSIDEYAEVITTALCAFFPEGRRPRLYTEPGTALVADAMVFVCPVLDIKYVEGRRIALVNGSNHNINHKWSGERLPFRLVHQGPARPRPHRQTSIVGNTCIEKDWLVADSDEPIEIGDYLCFEFCGGYTNVLKQPFIHPCQPIVAEHNGDVFEIKRQETVDDILRTYCASTLPRLALEENARDTAIAGND